ncbi:type I phosphodiesterase/nucleotide pyrophosphatase [Pyrolobus fumarii 1A]|uniref:Type I phosphodiesterase/nucleotide pyrophosphatase n=1 Tax=Pyrolobus fumarii (strain DSM 11204 / 1A) TaxID=694429 RepID=G0EF78_PYRF1|nr:alkaline phosphatase family protein [Pyrolobus fumarii]AEM38121.1 type I phosphodiesterase/nucleotide pyrophosphatase [Pyrolobus fumarii 1A]
MSVSKGRFQHRVLMLGIDGLSVDVYKALRGHGYLRSLSQLESRGVTGSVPMVPPFTPPMWTSIVSGVNPGKHGIYYFFLTDEVGRPIRVHMATDVMRPRIHDIVSYHGGESLVVNLPFSSWPLIPFRGALISDWLSPRDYAKPEWLNELYKKVLGEVSREYSKRSEICGLLAHDMALIETVARASRRGLLKDKAYVFIMMRFVDAIVHGHPDEIYNPRDDCLRHVLGAFDELMEEVLIPEFMDNGLILIVSDHGVDRASYRVSIPRILYDYGLVKIRLKKVSESLARETGGKEPLVARLVNMLMRNRITGKIVTRIGRKVMTWFPRLRRVAVHVERPTIDEENSPVVMPHEWSMGIYVNTRVVDDVKSVVERVREALEEFQRETGHHFAYSIDLGRGGIFHGPYVNRAPHIVVSPRRGYSLASANIYAPPVDPVDGRIGDHHPANMHLVVAPSGDPMLEEAARHIKEPWDYAVIALLALGLPLPHDTDSRLCERLGIKCEYTNYNTRYMISRRLAMKTGSGVPH